MFSNFYIELLTQMLVHMHYRPAVSVRRHAVHDAIEQITVDVGRVSLNAAARLSGQRG